LVRGVGTWLYSSIKDALCNIGGEAYKALHNVIAALLNSISGIELPLIGKPFKGLIGTIPMLATGGIITQPTIAMVGERGPEAVVPLRGDQGMQQPVTININAPIYGVDDLERTLRNLMARERMGYSAYR
jgi:hypothetical protein